MEKEEATLTQVCPLGLSPEGSKDTYDQVTIRKEPYGLLTNLTDSGSNG